MFRPPSPQQQCPCLRFTLRTHNFLCRHMRITLSTFSQSLRASIISIIAWHSWNDIIAADNRDVYASAANKCYARMGTWANVRHVGTSDKMKWQITEDLPNEPNTDDIAFVVAKSIWIDRWDFTPYRLFAAYCGFRAYSLIAFFSGMYLIVFIWCFNASK